MIHPQVIKDRLAQLSLRVAKLRGIQAENTDRLNLLTSQVSLAKGRAALHDEVVKVFEALQEDAHAKSVGSFESLLSAVLQDVFPGEGTIKLTPEYKGNATWLDIGINRNGNLEDVLEANGGAVTNVVCAGLRYIALVRSTNRRLMILDEPDCWLKPEKVGAFFKVISQVSDSAKAQTFFVSHHPSSYFEGQATIIELKRAKPQGILVNVLAPAHRTWVNDTEVGLRSIELINIRQHSHTVIPCFPGANALIGDNNIGKSAALVSAFRAMCYGESKDSLISHGKDEGIIKFHLENNTTLEMSRKRNRNPVVIYTKYVNGQPVKTGSPKTQNSVPDWVAETLGVRKVDDLDIQLSKQKEPVFLLNDSAPKRATILSVGKESSNLKALMKEYEDLRVSDRDTIRKGEAELVKVAAKDNYLKNLTGLDSLLADCLFTADDLIEALEKELKVSKLFATLSNKLAVVTTIETGLQSIRELPPAPVLADILPLTKLTVKLAKSQAIAGLTIPPLPTTKELAPVAEMGALCRKWEKAQKISMLEYPAVPVAPVLVATQDLTALISKLTRALKFSALSIPPLSLQEPILKDSASTTKLLQTMTATNTRLVAAEASLTQVEALKVQCEKELQELVEESNGQCPLCGHLLEEGTLHHGSH